MKTKNNTRIELILLGLSFGIGFFSSHLQQNTIKKNLKFKTEYINNDSLIDLISSERNIYLQTEKGTYIGYGIASRKFENNTITQRSNLRKEFEYESSVKNINNKKNPNTK
jgi:hypothetical protein